MANAGTVKKARAARRFAVLINTERCKGCELCVAVCGRKALGMSMDLNAKGMHYVRVLLPDGCTACLNCALICPDAAIEIQEETD